MIGYGSARIAQQQQANQQGQQGTPGKNTSEPERPERQHGPPESQGGEPVTAGAWEGDGVNAAMGLTDEEKAEANAPRYGCENGDTDADSPECFLTHDSRSELRTDLLGFVSSAMQNFHAAIGRVRMDKMLEGGGEAWGFLAEFLFYSLTGPLIGAAVKGFKKAKEAAKVAKELDEMLKAADIAVKNSTKLGNLLARVSDEDATAMLQNVSRGVRTTLKNAASNHESSKPWDQFLAIIEEQIKPMSDAIFADTPKTLNDAQFWIFTQGYRDGDSHSVASYQGFVADCLARFHTQKLDELNSPLYNQRDATVRTVKLEAYGSTVTAILAEHEGYGRKGSTSMVGEEKTHEDYAAPSRYLISIVDEDLAPYATAISHANVEIIHCTEDDHPALEAQGHLIQENDVTARFEAFIKRAKIQQSVSDAAGMVSR